MAPPTLEAAFAYSKLGWKLFPVRGESDPEHAKHPAHGIKWNQESTNDPERLAAWFSGTGYGIGLDCGASNLVALDADRPELIPDIPLQDAWMLRGNPERQSYLFDQPGDIGCSPGSWKAGEVKGNGGYICLPPTYHAIGGRYRWVTIDGSRVLPPEVRSLLMPTCNVVSMSLNKRLAAFQDKDQGRYNNMVAGVWELTCLQKEGHQGATDMLPVLKEAYLLSIKNDRDTGHEEWNRAVRLVDARVGVRQQVRCQGPHCSIDAPVATPDGIQDAIAKRLQTLQVNREANRLLRLAEADDWEMPTRSSIGQLLKPRTPDRIGQLLNDAGTALLVAQRKTGKTTLLMNLVRSLLTGDDFLDTYPVIPVTRGLAVFDMEMTPELLGDWMQRIGVGDDERLSIFNARGRTNKWFSILNTDPDRFTEFLAPLDIEIMILDPLAPFLAALGVDENDNSGVRQAFTLLRDVVSAAGVKELILAHHAGWPTIGGGTRSRGASAFEDSADVIWRLGRDEEGIRHFSAFGRLGEVEKQPIAFGADLRMSISTAPTPSMSLEEEAERVWGLFNNDRDD